MGKTPNKSDIPEAMEENQNRIQKTKKPEYARMGSTRNGKLPKRNPESSENA